MGLGAVGLVLEMRGPQGDLPTPPAMEPSGGARRERPKPREPAARLEKAKQKSAQQELKQRQRAEVSGGATRGPRRPILPPPVTFISLPPSRFTP